MAAAVRTVRGDLPPGELGVCDAHDHLFLTSRALPGQELADVPAAEAELQSFAAAGGRSVVQWTPAGMGRHAGVLPELSRSTGVHIVAATGLHQARHYPPEAVDQLLADLPERLIADLTTGIGGGPRAGVVKVAGGFHGLDDHARRVMRAAAEAHHATGAPICVHLEAGTAAIDVLELLCTDLAVPAGRVVLGHLNRSPDIGAHAEAAQAGALLGFDGPSRANHATDWRLFEVLGALIEAGHGHQLLLGGDTTTAAARGNPGMPFLLRRLRPRLEREWGADLAADIFVHNPARAFAADWRQGSWNGQY